VLCQDLVIDPALEGYPVAWFAPTYKLLAEPWREIRRTLKPITRSSNATEKRIELITGGSIDMWSLDDQDAARGYKYKRIVVDEAAMVKKLEEAWQAAIRPTLADYQGDAFFPSTPKGMNFYWQMYQWGQDPEMKEWMSWTMPTSENPYIESSEIDAMYRQMPERLFQQEVLAEFIEDAGVVFRHVRDCATATEQKEAEAGHTYVFGVDWGKLKDFTVITVIDKTAKQEVFKDRFNQIDYQVQLQRLQALYERFKPYKIIAEKNSMGEPLIEQLYRSGMPVEAFLTTNDSKAAIIDSLALAFEKGAIEILPDPVAIAELQAYEVERLPSGRFRYNAPEGFHDDCVMSMALAWSEVSKPMDWLVF
jgi:phage FluMu gp28-like protein